MGLESSRLLYFSLKCFRFFDVPLKGSHVGKFSLERFYSADLSLGKDTLDLNRLLKVALKGRCLFKVSLEVRQCVLHSIKSDERPLLLSPQLLESTHLCLDTHWSSQLVLEKCDQLIVSLYVRGCDCYSTAIYMRLAMSAQSA